MDFDYGNATAAAARSGRDRLTQLAHAPNLDEARMAKIARAAVFEEALLSALHSRLSELRTVTK